MTFADTRGAMRQRSQASLPAGATTGLPAGASAGVHASLHLRSLPTADLRRPPLNQSRYLLLILAVSRYLFVDFHSVCSFAVHERNNNKKSLKSCIEHC